MRKLFVNVAAAATVACLASQASAGGVTVSNAWARATPSGSAIGAVFMDFKAAADQSDKLLSASSAVAGRVELHTHVKDGDVMRMRRVDSIELPAGESHALRPGGDHVMLFDLKQPLAEGDALELALTFEKAGTVDVVAAIGPVGALKAPEKDAAGREQKTGADAKSSDSPSHEHHGAGHD